MYYQHRGKDKNAFFGVIHNLMDHVIFGLEHIKSLFWQNATS